jgi:hypothetical protein
VPRALGPDGEVPNHDDYLAVIASVFPSRSPHNAHRAGESAYDDAVRPAEEAFVADQLEVPAHRLERVGVDVLD